MLSERWAQSRYSENLYHLRLKNYRNPGNDLVAELERDHSGNVWPSVRLAGEQLSGIGDEPYPDLESAERACLKRIQHLFQCRRAGFVMEFQPFQKIDDIQSFYAIARGTAHYWKTGVRSVRGGNPVRYEMPRKSINQVLGAMGFVFGGQGGGVVGIRTPQWDEKELDNADET